MSNFWRDRRVFVTGGSGLIGGWLVEELLNQGADVIVLLRDWVPHSKLLSEEKLTKTTIVRGDLSDPTKLERILSEYEVQNVIHLIHHN